MMDNEFKIKAYTQKELLRFYGVTHKTFKKWLRPIKKKIGELTGKCYTIKQVRIIVEHIGHP